MKQRYCRITLTNDKTRIKRVYDDLSVSFEVSVSSCGSFAHGVVRIDGLSTETIQEYTMFTPNWTTSEYRKRLTLDVGYIEEDGTYNVSTILDGYIERAIPMARPNRTLVINVISILTQSFQTKSISAENISLKELVQKIGQTFNITSGGINSLFKVQDFTNRADKTIVKKYVCVGNLQQHLNEVEKRYYKKGGFRVWYNLGQLYIGDYEMQSGSKGQLKIGGNGLLLYGVPTPYIWGCIVRTEITNLLKLFQHFELKSELIPAMNGEYNPFAITYVGESRGQNWYAEISATVVTRSVK